MNFLKKPEIKKITMEQATIEIENCLNGKDKSIQARFIKTWYKARQAAFPLEDVKTMLILEKYNKHNDLYNKKTNLEQIKKEVEEELK